MRTKQRWMRLLICLMAVVYIAWGCANDGSPVSSTSAAGQSGQSQGESENRGDSAGENEGAPEKRILVVTTVFPPYDFAKRIAGDRAEVVMLLSPGMESHTYEPTPEDIKRIASADLFIHAGSANDTWVESVVPDHVPRLEMMQLVEVLGFDHDHDHGDHDHGDHDHSDGHHGDDHDHSGDEDGDHDHNDGHDHSGHDHGDHDHDHHHGDHDHLDEHVWTSPVNAIIIVEGIARRLGELDPEHASFYHENAHSYIEELQQLDADYRNVVSHAERRLIVFADRFPFRYLAHEYGLEYEAAFSGCSTETEVSAAVIADLIDEVKEHALSVVFKMELTNDNIARTVAESSGATVLELHSCHNLSAEEIANGENYLTLMRKNLEALKKALQ